MKYGRQFFCRFGSLVFWCQVREFICPFECFNSNANNSTLNVINAVLISDLVRQEQKQILKSSTQVEVHGLNYGGENL